MMKYLSGAWAGLDATGRTVLIICVALVIIVGILYGADMTWVLGL